MGKKKERETRATDNCEFSKYWRSTVICFVTGCWREKKWRGGVWGAGKKTIYRSTSVDEKQ